MPEPATMTRVGAMLGIKEYPTPSVVGMFNRLLSAPFAFVLTQSFTFLTKTTGQSLLQRQFNRMANAGDFAVSQACDLKDALDGLTSNEFAMGDHHFSLQVLADVAEAGGDQAGGERLKSLNDHIALARSLLADTGMLVSERGLGNGGPPSGRSCREIFPVRPPQGADHFAGILRQWLGRFTLPGGACERKSLGRRIELICH